MIKTTLPRFRMTKDVRHPSGFMLKKGVVVAVGPKMEDWLRDQNAIIPEIEPIFVSRPTFSNNPCEGCGQ